MSDLEVIVSDEVLSVTAVNAEDEMEVVIEDALVAVVHDVVAIGTAGEGDIVSKLAGESISALRVVRGDASGTLFYADNDVLANADSAIGVTVNAGGIGATISVRTFGEMTDAGWSWTIGAVYLGSNGVLTQTPPTTGILLRVGKAIAPTIMLVDIEQPITLT